MLVQAVGMLLLFGGVAWIMVTVLHNASAAVQLCSGTSCGRESYVAPVILAAAGYVVAMTGFIRWRRRALKLYGTAPYLGRRRRRPPMSGMPGRGMPGSLDPPQFPGGLPPGTPGSPTGPPP